MLSWKKLTLVCCVLTLLFVCSPAQAYVQLNVGDVVRVFDGPGTGTNGGEFILKKGGVTVHRTFCLETSEYLNFNQDLVITSITDEARYNGDKTEPLTTDPVSDEVKYLFYNFVSGTLEGYDYLAATNNVANSTADQLQRAIWWFEGETGGQTNQFTELAQEWSSGPTYKDTKTFYQDHVKVLNILWNGAPGQDLLYAVPEPASVAVWGFIASVFGGAFYLRRRRAS